MLTEIRDGTISFVHPHPPKGAHKTYAPWLDRKLEKVDAVELSSSAYHELCGAIISKFGRNPLRERRSDNRLVFNLGDIVFCERVVARKIVE